MASRAFCSWWEYWTDIQSKPHLCPFGFPSWLHYYLFLYLWYKEPKGNMGSRLCCRCRILMNRILFWNMTVIFHRHFCPSWSETSYIRRFPTIKSGYKRGLITYKCVYPKHRRINYQNLSCTIVAAAWPLTVIVQHIKVSINMGDPVTTGSRWWFSP